MEKNSAAKIVRQTFQNPFDRDSFIYFIKSLLNHIEPAPFIYRGNFIPDAYKSYIKTFERVGKYQDKDDKKIDLLIVHLKKEKSLERARTIQRNFIAWYLNGSRGDILKDAALVAFVSPDSDDWRFSLVKMDYRIDASKEKVKVKQELTPARRFSFLVGKNESSHTAQSQLLDILEDDGNNPTLVQIEDAFSVEKVTKKFYQEYKKLFDKLCEEFNKDRVFQMLKETQGINTGNFAKKLLGQIVFLYFIQKKGWLGVSRNKKWGEGDRSFLRTIFNKCEKEKNNFFNDYLEYLFYDTLNKKPDLPGSFYRKYFNSQIPFLNGGLFEPMKDYNWKDTFLSLDNDLFSNIAETGILDVFDRYNFTVKEDEPLEKEVAVDPEMLGKVFENLLGENLRKGKGTYYTPREIVHYMCRESLVNYLVTESNLSEEKIRKYIDYSNINFSDLNKKWKSEWFEPGQFKKLDGLLKNIKIVDPACGSGAFLVGMLQEIVKLRIFLQLTPDSELFLDPSENTIKEVPEYQLKKETIQNCIYGVDIDPGAVEIAKLRLWLSLVVDYELEKIEPLPNLDYKVMQGNSLLEELVLGNTTIKLFDPNLVKEGREKMKNLFEEEKQKELFEQQLSIKKIMEQLDQFRKEYFKISDLSEKLKTKKQIEDIEQNLVKQCVDKEIKKLDVQIRNIGDYITPGIGLSYKDTKKQGKIISTQAEIMRIWREFRESGIRPFFLWHLYFADVFQQKHGFDIVIANPPYVKEYVNKNAFNGLRISPYYQGKMDLWYMFACKGIDLVRKGSGILTFIAQNNWVTSYGASKMRDKVIHDTQILALLDFGDFKVFETAGIQTMVMIFERNGSQNEYTFDYRRIINNNPVLNDIIDLLNKNKSPNCQYLKPLIDRKKLSGKSFVFSDSEVEFVLNKIYQTGNFKLDAVKEVAQGIVCPQDFVNKAGQERIGLKYNVGTGIFVLKSGELEVLDLSKKELTLIKPFYTTKELHKWSCFSTNKKWIVYTDSSFKDREKIKEYPKIKKHLDKFKKVITSDNRPYGLHRARDEYFFKGEKIIVARKCQEPSFTYTDFDSYVSATFYVIKTKRMDQKYLTGLLNSRLIAFWLRHKGKMQGNNYQIDKEPILEIPLIKPSEIEHKRIKKIIDKIFAITKDDDYLQNETKQKKVKEYEHQIDKMVYKLYDLTPREIKIVEKEN